MKKFDRSEVTGAYEEILRDRFGELYDWQKPEIQRSVGPCNQQVFDEFDARLDYILYECYQALLSANFSELEAIYTRGVQRGADIWDAWVDAFGGALGDLKKDKPHWAAGGFGHPEYMADFEYWGRMSNLYLHEAVSLSLGVEPEHLTDLWDDSYEVLGMIAPPLVLLKRRREQFKRQFNVKHAESTIAAAELLEWLKHVELEVHPDALASLERFHGEQSAVPASSKRPDKRELDSVAALFTAMAIEQFGYDPTAKRSPTVRELQDLAASLGIMMSDDTIRHYLRHGAKFIDPGWKPHER